MGIMQEDFARCKQCGHNWFLKRETFVLAKTSTYDNPIELRKHITYHCEHCESIACSKEEGGS